MSGYHLMKMRLDRGMSQKELAKMINYSRSQLSRVENDIQHMREDSIDLLADAFEVSREEIIEAINQPKPVHQKTENDSIYDKMDDLRLSIANEMEESNEITSKRIEQMKQQIQEQADELSEQNLKMLSLTKDLEFARKELSQRTKLFIFGLIFFLILIPFVMVGILLYMNTRPVNPANAVPVSVEEIKDSEV